ncbi:hypothetical protein Ais01nite_02160 [Asanoa ishikariensis]|nr:hypothetical protein Ais01nite_02160 [Asanoa ishikariensis]
MPVVVAKLTLIDSSAAWAGDAATVTVAAAASRPTTNRAAIARTGPGLPRDGVCTGGSLMGVGTTRSGAALRIDSLGSYDRDSRMSMDVAPLAMRLWLTIA